MKAIAVYMRVSTDKQDHRMQRHAIDQWLMKHRPKDTVTFYIETESGSKDTRTELGKMQADIEAGKVQTVVVYRLDRLSRKATTALSMLIKWIAGGIEFYATEQPALSASKEDPFRLTKLAMFSEIAEIERETIVARVKSGLAAAKSRGVKLGRVSQVTNEQREIIFTSRKRGIALRTIAAETGLTVSTVYRTLNKSKGCAK
jgi:DNA invertase Pin-like site-specific DNA recombinase